jgi:hypothetical protein
MAQGSIPEIIHVNERGTLPSRFPEGYLVRGPQQIGVTGDNSLITLIGRSWFLGLSVERELVLYQRNDETNAWVRVTSLLPPVFDEVQPESRRRFSLCFDQSARVCLAFEEDAVVKIVRWDPSLNQYIANVSFAGVDPVVAFDATWSYDVNDSDVLVFYLDVGSRSVLRYRVQRQLFATENTLFSYGQPVVLDRVQRLPIRYQVLASDVVGEPLQDDGVRVALVSDLYPYPWTDALETELAPDGAWDHAAVLFEYENEDDVEAADLAPNGTFDHASTLYTHVPDVDDVEAADLAPNGTFDHVLVLFVSLDEDEVDATDLEPVGPWDHKET